MLRELQDTIIRCDHMVWYYLNTRWHNAFLDFLMPFFRNQWFWAPLYLFLLIYIPRRWGKLGWLWCGAFIISFALSDQVSAHLLKPYFNRLRPCNDPYLSTIVHLVVPCGPGKSFPSSHAANHFCLALFSIVTLRHIAKWVWIAGITWAALVCYAQVYVGVHFPLDVAFGGLIGAIIGWCTGTVFNRRFKFS